MAAASCSWRDRRRDPEDPPAVDLPRPTAPLLAQRLAEALSAVVLKALDPGPEEENAAAALASRLSKGKGREDALGADDAEEAAGARFCGRPRLAERVPLTVEFASKAAPPSKGLGSGDDEQQPPLQQPQEPSPPPADDAAQQQPAAEDGSGRRSARQASRASAGKRPAWAALMAGSGEDSWWSEDEDEDEEETAGKGKKRKRKRGAAGGANEPPARPRTVGRAPVQVFRGVVPRAAIDLLMKGEQADAARNPWPGVQGLLRSFMQRTFATSFRHPYIAEIFSRCDSVGPPQRLDLALSPSGVHALLTPPAIAAVEAIVWGLKHALQFTGKVTWDSHLVIVLPGAPEQRFHVDSARSWFYFTLLMPLTKDPPSAGRTEFFHSEDQPPVPVGVGDCLCFDGRRRHRGQRNGARSHVRVFLYIAVYSGTDYN